MKSRTPLWVVFWLLVTDFAFILLIYVLSAIIPTTNIAKFYYATLVSSLLLGLVLLILTLRGRVGAKLQKPLVLTASSAIAFSFSNVLLSVTFSDENPRGLLPFLLTLGLMFGTAITFLVGAVKTVTLYLDQSRQDKRNSETKEERV